MVINHAPFIAYDGQVVPLLSRCGIRAYGIPIFDSEVVHAITIVTKNVDCADCRDIIYES